MNVYENPGELSQSVLAPAADLVRSVAGTSAWGMSVVLLSVAWQLPLWRWTVRSCKARIVRAAALDGFAEHLDPDADVRHERRTHARAALDQHGLRSTSDLLVGRVRTVLAIFTALVVVVWSRTGSAADYPFAGLDDLHGAPIRSGIAGVAWALALAAAATAAQITLQRAAGVRDRRDRFFATRIAPVIFLCLGLFLPGGTVVAFVAVMVLGLIVTVVATRDTSLATLGDPRTVVVTR